MTDTYGNQGGVCGHSTADFWQEYDLYKLVNLQRDIVGEHCLIGIVPAKPMAYTLFKDGRTDVGNVLMVSAEHRRTVWATLGIQRGDELFQDAFWSLSRPDNLGGGRFTRSISLMSWDSDEAEQGTPLGYVHGCSGDDAFEKAGTSLVFNDFTQGLHWYVDEHRCPFPGRKPTRSLGTAFAPSVGHRYGSNVHA